MRDTIFKGATRPPMMLGVPMLPFLLVAIVAGVGSMWVLQGFGLYAAFLTVMGGIGTLVAMREISKQDDQRLNQLLLRWRDALYRRNRSHWNAHSMSPIEFDRRSN